MRSQRMIEAGEEAKKQKQSGKLAKLMYNIF